MEQSATIPRVLSSTTIVGDPVKNNFGESLGEVKDLMIDLERGRVAYAVLSFGGFLGFGDKLFAIPWSALRVNPEDKSFTLNVSKERIERAPGFDKDHWPDMADSTWSAGIHSYYGISPYWE